MVDQKFNNQIQKIENELIYKSTKPEVIEQFFKNENFPKIESLNEEAQLFLFQKNFIFTARKIRNS